MHFINDVATDVQKPPAFRKAQIGDLPEGTPKVVSETYPDLKPLRYPYKDQHTVFSAMLVGVLTSLDSV